MKPNAVLTLFALAGWAGLTVLGILAMKWLGAESEVQATVGGLASLALGGLLIWALDKTVAE